MATPATTPDADRDFSHFYEIITAFAAAAPRDDGSILIVPFLDAMNKFLRIFDALSSPLYSDIVKKDVNGNISKLGAAGTKYDATTLDAVVEAELSEPSYAEKVRSEQGPGRNSGAVATLWMKRTVQFIHGLILNLLDDPGMTLSEASQKSYALNLGLCHPWVTRKVFSAGLRFAPARDVFYRNLGAGNDDQRVNRAMAEFVDAVNPLLKRLTEMFKVNNLEKCIP